MGCKVERPYEYGEHTADILIVAYGCTLEESFINSALAVMDVMYHVERVEARETREIAIEADDMEQLLFKWIDDVLYLFDGEKFAPSRHMELALVHNGACKLRAVIHGERYDIERHGFRGTIVKAMTYHEMSIERRGDVWRVQFVVDV